MVRNFFTFGLILIAALSRLLPHPDNVTPIAAIALFGGAYLDRKHTFLVPLAAMFLSDVFLGFHSAMGWVYASFVLIGFVGLWLRKHEGVVTTVGATLLSSLLFFIITNLGVWMSAQVVYAPTLAGLIECYVAAIPFFRNTMVGDLVFVGIMFGTYALACRMWPRLGLRQSM